MPRACQGLTRLLLISQRIDTRSFLGCSHKSSLRTQRSITLPEGAQIALTSASLSKAHAQACQAFHDIILEGLEPQSDRKRACASSAELSSTDRTETGSLIESAFGRPD